MIKIPHFYDDPHYSNKNEFEIAKHVVTSGTPFSSDELFTIVRQRESKRISVIGGAGFGKTTELKKLARKLVNTNCSKEYPPNREEPPVVHFIDIKKIRSKPSTTLYNILFEHDIEHVDDRKRLFEWFKNNQSKVIILLDGLDQSLWNTDEVHGEVPDWEEASTGALMYNLLSGNILPDVTVVMTSRENAMTTLPEKARPKIIVALKGLKKDDAIKLFSELLHDESDITHQNIKNLDIITIPIYTIFTAVVCKYCAGRKEKTPEYVTGLLAKIFEIFIKNKCEQMRKKAYEDTHKTSEQILLENVEVLHKIMKMAYEGMKEGRMTFEEKHLNQCELTVDQVADLMRKVPGGSINFFEGVEILIFSHQTLQEFLSACYISKIDQSFRSMIRRRDFKSIVRRHFVGYWDRSHWITVIQYLYGIIFNSEVKFDQGLHKGRYFLKYSLCKCRCSPEKGEESRIPS